MILSGVIARISVWSVPFFRHLGECDSGIGSGRFPTRARFGGIEII